MAQVEGDPNRRVGPSWSDARAAYSGVSPEVTQHTQRNSCMPGVELDYAEKSAPPTVTTDPGLARIDGGFHDVDAAFGRITVDYL